MTTSGVAVVTGAASGFGRALAERCAATGLDVVLLDIDGAGAEREAAAIGATHGVGTLGWALDVADADAVDRVADEVRARFGRVDVLCSNVGVQLFGALERLSDEEWRWVMDVNVLGAVRVVRAFLPLLRVAPQGRIAFTASSSVLSPAMRMPAYQTSKFAVLGLAESLRLDLAADGITVSVVFPSGMTTTHLQSSEAARPAALGPGVVDPSDVEVLLASNASMASAVATAEEAARGVLEGVLAGVPYLVTHGDLVDDVAARSAAFLQAAERARGPARDG